MPFGESEGSPDIPIVAPVNQLIEALVLSY